MHEELTNMHNHEVSHKYTFDQARKMNGNEDLQEQKKSCSKHDD